MVTIRDAFPGFSVDDIDAAREFYGTKLGLTVEDGSMGDLQLTLPSGQSVFVYPKPDHRARDLHDLQPRRRRHRSRGRRAERRGRRDEDLRGRRRLRHRRAGHRPRQRERTGT